MVILGHGSDTTLAPTIRPVARQAGNSVHQAVDHLADAGFPAVQLDAAFSGIRPRDLDHRARRDLSSLLVRRDMRLAGIDLFIPRRHFTDPQQQDRALSAVIAAITLAADLGKVPVSIALPIKDVADDIRQSLVGAADSHGVCLAVHAEDQLEALDRWVQAVDLPALGMAIDPAALIARGLDPAAITQRYARSIAVGRLSDLQAGSDETSERPAGLRCSVGEGDLAIPAYRVSLDLCPSRRGPVVLDLRGMEEPMTAARQARDAWDSAAFRL
jgi:sugar phosphate isomerase/epimerase